MLDNFEVILIDFVHHTECEIRRAFDKAMYTYNLGPSLDTFILFILFLKLIIMLLQSTT